MEDVMRRDGLYGFEYVEEDGRRVASEERKNHNIKSLWQRNHEIVNLAARGFKQTEIAEILGITPQTVSNTLNSQLGKMKLSDIRKSRDDEARVVSEKINALTRKALRVYDEIFENPNGEATLKDRKDVADTIVLELSGLRAPTKSITATLSAEEIAEFKSRGRAAAAQEGVTIDVSPEGGE